jgi:hypothetical protein
VPLDADMVFDVRFLPNPHFVPEFRKLTGLDPKVAAYVRGFPQTREFLDRVTKLMLYLLPHYVEEGKSYLTVAFGCTGGQHRSVMMAEEMQQAALHREKAGYQVKAPDYAFWHLQSHPQLGDSRRRQWVLVYRSKAGKPRWRGRDTGSKVMRWQAGSILTKRPIWQSANPSCAPNQRAGSPSSHRPIASAASLFTSPSGFSQTSILCAATFL